jgi:hypothetical protein
VPGNSSVLQAVSTCGYAKGCEVAGPDLVHNCKGNKWITWTRPSAPQPKRLTHYQHCSVVLWLIHNCSDAPLYRRSPHNKCASFAQYGRQAVALLLNLSPPTHPLPLYLPAPALETGPYPSTPCLQATSDHTRTAHTCCAALSQAPSSRSMTVSAAAAAAAALPTISHTCNATQGPSSTRSPGYGRQARYHPHVTSCHLYG